ncbi:hypothetical protein SD37_11100 [Amycolatopsis orientalis]|uniref:Uncharacterized protein n=1 Tax=Amycolatopsis orientalis TaxID=31958 RepID=A0A193BVD2_AMYOR|nr:hypothetical protein SD37_11100 [Amycolatopsis orientalis]
MTPVRTIVMSLGLATLTALVLNAVIALVAKRFDERGIGVGLASGEYLPLTLLGIVIGTVGWSLVARFTVRISRVVVPFSLVVSWVPDMLLFQSGATAANVIGLMLMHVVVAAAVVFALRSVKWRSARSPEGVSPVNEPVARQLPRGRLGGD